VERFRPIPKDGTIGVFAPSSPFVRERFDRGVEILRGLGFSVHVHPQTEARKGFLAGEDDARANAFAALLEDGRVDAVIAARGGYGAHRWIDRFDFSRVRRARKPVIGFSDVCVLHARIQAAGLCSIHGPVVTQLVDLPPEQLQHLAALLTEPETIQLEATTSIQGGRAEGVLVGGNLSVIAPLVGTPYLFVPEGSILLLEDVGEAPYRIDRLLTHLRLAGVLSRVAGIAVGDMVGCQPPREGEQTVEEVLDERLGDLGVPAVRGLPFGHGRTNLALTLGAEAVLDADGRTLIVKA
jgi:muramoyltetrapeptide carboxypeptidase